MSRNASLDKLKARLARVPAAVRAEVNREVEKQAGQVVVKMRLKAPVGATGNLRHSIGFTMRDMRASILAGGEPTEKEGSRGIARSFVQGLRAGLRGRRARKGGTYDYAFAVEFGTQKMTAKPFFYPTWRRARGGVGKAIKAAVKRGLHNVR